MATDRPSTNDVVVDRSTGPYHGTVNYSLLGRVVIAKMAQGEPVPFVTVLPVCHSHEGRMK